MAHEHLTYDDLLCIVQLIKSTEHFSEFRLKVGEIELELRRRRAAGAAMPASAPGAANRIESMPAADQAKPAEARATWPEGSVIIRSPMVGTFYRSPAPGATPFVEVGQAVEPDTTVCIIEVMKLMNSIAAGAHGTVVQVLVDDSALVEAAQPLIVLRPCSVEDDLMRIA
ncbi:MAG TPA: acetyl-CoA carboxylase biotin carboxyl carrier protein [Burkholderiaceae bacterium]|nr:acetyl-CoA carboxylase biotin carboxyl carrier protein [Burkholderiaceae bacterium]